MLYPVYKCDDYDFNNDVLTIYNAELVAQIKTITEWSVIKTYMEITDCVICPSMFTDKNNNTANIVIFTTI